MKMEQPDAQPSVEQELAQRRRLKAWADAGATNIPALLVALSSALVGAVTMVIRRRRRR